MPNKTRQDFGITYDLEVLRLMDIFRKHDLVVNSVVVTRYEDNSPAVDVYKRQVVEIDVPRNLSDEAKQKLVEFDRAAQACGASGGAAGGNSGRPGAGGSGLSLIHILNPLPAMLEELMDFATLQKEPTHIFL